MATNQDFLFKLVSKKIADSDFSGYTFQYPPLFTWKKAGAEKKVQLAWQKKLIEKNEHLGIYIHIPFCKQRCTYCRYFAKKLDQQAELEEFLVSLKKEISFLAPYFANQKIHTLYLGGGTPSILNETQISELFECLHGSFDFSVCRQTVFEGNPDLLTLSKLKLLKKYRVNRLTIGVQSLDQKVIDLANRFQTSGSFQKCIKDAKKVKIGTINVDLMVGLPQQNSASFLKTLEEVISLAPDMIHLHPFFPTNLTAFAKNKQKISVKEIKKREKMSEIGQLILQKNGYKRNELDASSKEQKDVNMQLADAIAYDSSFLGLGPGAVSHIAGALRYANVNDVDLYNKALAMGKLPTLSACKLSSRDDMIYYVISCLRYGRVDKEKFEKLFAKKLEEVFFKEIAYLVKRKKIENTSEALIPKFKDLGEYSVFSKYFYAEKITAQCKKEVENQKRTFEINDREEVLFMDLI